MGTVDEHLGYRGITHLVEHLALRNMRTALDRRSRARTFRPRSEELVLVRIVVDRAVEESEAQRKAIFPMVNSMSEEKSSTDWPKLFGMAAYELAIPSTLISGYAGLLQSSKIETAGRDVQERLKRESVGAAVRAAKQLRQIQFKMDALVRFETGRSILRPKVGTSVEDLVREVIATPVWRLEPEVAIDILVSAGETAVMADAEGLKRALSAVLWWVFRELGRKGRRTMHVRVADSAEPPSRNIVMAETAELTQEALLRSASLESLNDYQDGTSLDLPLATRTIAANGG